MVNLAIANDRILAKAKTTRIVYPIVVRLIPVPVRGTTGG
jgi:hypothetical protein